MSESLPDLEIIAEKILVDPRDSVNVRLGARRTITLTPSSFVSVGRTSRI
jgi:hypothetical protein